MACNKSRHLVVILQDLEAAGIRDGGRGKDTHKMLCLSEDTTKNRHQCYLLICKRRR